MEQANISYFKAALIVLLLALISFCIYASVINPFETLPFFFSILIAVSMVLSVLVLFKSRQYLISTDGISILKMVVSLVLAIVFFSSIMSIFNQQIKSLIVSKKYDDYYVRIAEQDRNQPVYYYFAVGRQKNNEKYLVNFEKNHMMRNFTYLTGEDLDKFANLIKTSRDKNLIKLYDDLNKDNRISLNEMIQLQEFIIKYGVHNEKPPF
jgi:energy-coupling factor transporter transmembrane protein EcfT